MDKNKDSFGRFDFIGKAWLFGSVSLVLTVASLIYLAVADLNYGIDFRGGTEMQMKFAQDVKIEDVRKTVENMDIGDISVQDLGGNDFVLRFQGKAGQTDKETNELLNDSIAKVRSNIDTQFADNKPTIERVDTVGPQVGAELKRNGLLATFYCLLAILIYVGLRFDYNYAPGAVVCLFHDAVVTLAIFNLVGKEINVAIVAAIMTLIGLSLNDTIVVFDRMREITAQYLDKSFGFVINKSINEMLIRTLITSGTTLVSSLCLGYFSDGTVGDIAFVISVGVLLGTYSSVYVAAPFVLLMDKITAKKA